MCGLVSYYQLLWSCTLPATSKSGFQNALSGFIFELDGNHQVVGSHAIIIINQRNKLDETLDISLPICVYVINYKHKV